MLKTLKNFLNLFKRFNSKVNNTELLLPEKIHINEKIVRAIYSPINLHKNGEKLNNNFFKPKAGEDDISVNRLDYTTFVFLKHLAKIFENPEYRRNYFGFSMLKVMEIEDSGLRVIYSPLKIPVKNPFHADIKIDYIVEKGKELPAEVNYKIKKLTEKSRLFRDPNPDSKVWNGKLME
jgi:hypothetical protein